MAFTLYLLCTIISCRLLSVAAEVGLSLSTLSTMHDSWLVPETETRTLCGSADTGPYAELSSVW